MMAGGSDSRRSMASASVAAHRAEANVADARLARYNDRIGRVRKERAVWPGAAFIVEALLLLVFLTGSLAVLMNLNAEADRIGRESADLMDGLVLASNVAEKFAADPIAFEEAYEADPHGRSLVVAARARGRERFRPLVRRVHVSHRGHRRRDDALPDHRSVEGARP